MVEEGERTRQRVKGVIGRVSGVLSNPGGVIQWDAYCHA